MKGYSSTQKGYKLYSLHTKSFFVSRNVIFQEQIFSFKHMRDIGNPLFPVLDLLSSGDSVPCDVVPYSSPSSLPPQDSVSTPHMAPSKEASSPHEEPHITDSIPENAGDGIITEHISEPTTEHTLRRSSKIGR